MKTALRGEAVVAERSAPKPNRRAVADASRAVRFAPGPSQRRPVRQQVVYEQPRQQPGFFFFPFFR